MNKVYQVAMRTDDGIRYYRVSTRDADSAKATVLNETNAPESAVAEVRRFFNTMTEVREAVTAGGSHWFDADTLRFFRTRLSEYLYGGRYFVTSEENPSGERRYTVRVVVWEDDRWVIDTVGGFEGFHKYASRSGAHKAAERAAKRDHCKLSHPCNNH